MIGTFKAFYYLTNDNLPLFYFIKKNWSLIERNSMMSNHHQRWSVNSARRNFSQILGSLSLSICSEEWNLFPFITQSPTTTTSSETWCGEKNSLSLLQWEWRKKLRLKKVSWTMLTWHMTLSFTAAACWVNEVSSFFLNGQ